MNLSKSEGVWGNTETTSYSTETYRGQQGQPDRQPRTGGKTAKSGHILGSAPLELPLVLINYLFLFINSLFSYGLRNRRAINHSVWQLLLLEAYPLPRVPALLL